MTRKKPINGKRVDLVALVARIKELRVADHTSGCQCQECVRTRAALLAAGLWEEVYR